VASPLLAMGGKKEVRTDASTAVESENSMMMERFAGLELRLDTPKGTSFPCFARCHFPFLVLLVLPYVVLHVVALLGRPFVFCNDHKNRITPGSLHPLAYDFRRGCYFSGGGID
jgi:hypothetical protein